MAIANVTESVQIPRTLNYVPEWKQEAQAFKCASNDLKVTYSYKLYKGHFKSNPSITKEMGGKRHALADLPPGKSPSTACTEGHVGLPMSRYTDNAIPTALPPD